MHCWTLASVAVALAATASCQAASGSVTTTLLPTPSAAKGFEAKVVATGLTTPRGIIFDTAGNLLTVQRGLGVVALTFGTTKSSPYGVKSSKTVIADSTLNHGIELSPDGKTLYASSTESVYSWAYNAATRSNTTKPKVLVTGMTTSDHTTRTLLLSKQVPGTLIVTRGSTSNIDPQAEDLTTGHSQIKAFNLLNMTGKPYQFDTSGQLLGWGLRNDVGIAEHPTTHGIWSVENSVDQMTRNGVDIHATNPGEELNYLGTLANNTSPNQGSNFGYPQCYAAWNPSIIPDANGLKVGMQFAIGELSSTNNDTFCQNDRTAPRLVFEAHMAPLDIKFNQAGTVAWVSFHGSWDRSPLEPSGYKVSAIPFRNGQPIAASTSRSGYVDIVANQNNNDCPSKCFRPVGLAFDSLGRLFFSSDGTGEIYMASLASENGAVADAAPSNIFEAQAAASSASAAASAATSAAPNAAPRVATGGSLAAALIALAAAVLLSTNA